MKKYLTSFIMIFSIFTTGCNITPIDKSEFTIDEINNCIKISSSLKTRCHLAGGIVQNPITFVGIAVLHTLGCYPEGKTNDFGKKCNSDNDCEGKCHWTAGDAPNPSDTSICSDYKKPFFTYAEVNGFDKLCK